MHRWTLPLRAMLLGIALFLTVGVATGQRLEDGKNAFENSMRPLRDLPKQLFSGEVPANPNEKRHVEAIDLLAKDITYPLIWETQASRPKATKLNNIVEDFGSRLATMTRFRGNTTAMQHLYVRQVIDRVQEVVQKGKPIAAVNAARILAMIPERKSDSRLVVQTEQEWAADVLPRLAEGNADHYVAVVAGLLDDAKTPPDGVRYYLLQGAADVLSMPKQSPPLVKKETEEKIYQAAAKLVGQKVVFPKATPRQEIDGYRRLRAEAVRVLAQARVPAVGTKVNPALVLARVAGNDESLMPGARLQERIEAVIGIAHLGATAGKFGEFQLDAAVAEMCRAVVAFGNTAGENLDSKPAQRARPWKTDAARMYEALDELKATVKTPFVQNAVKQCQTVLASIERGTAGNANALSDWLKTNYPEPKPVFRTDPASVVKSADKPAE